MLSNTLNTNEIKNAAGTEQEFQHLDQDGRSHEFALISESPALPHRLKVQHLESGTGINKRRRSVVRFDKTIMSTVDATLPVTVSAYAVIDAPIGALTANTEMANVLANLMSFLATTGGGTTVLFDGTGNGASVLLSGGL
jgi:hypothetical protein